MIEVLQILESIAIILASVAAIYGVKTWKKEAKWKKETEFNEEVLLCFYICQDTIRYIRNPISFEIGNSTYIDSPNLSQRQNDSLRNAQVYFERYNKHIDTFSNLRRLKFRYKAIYPTKSLTPFDTVFDCITEVLIAARMLGQYYWTIDNTGKSEEVANANNKKITEYESTLYYEYSQPDKIDIRIDDAIKQIETSLNHKTY